MSTKFRKPNLWRNPKKPIDKSKSSENGAICGEADGILLAATRRGHHLYNVKDSGTERIRERRRLKGRRIDDTIVPARNWHLPYVKALPTRLSEPPKMFHLRIRIKEGGKRYFILSSHIYSTKRWIINLVKDGYIYFSKFVMYQKCFIKSKFLKVYKKMSGNHVFFFIARC